MDNFWRGAAFALWAMAAIAWLISIWRAVRVDAWLNVYNFAGRHLTALGVKAHQKIDGRMYPAELTGWKRG